MEYFVLKSLESNFYSDISFVFTLKDVTEIDNRQTEQTDKRTHEICNSELIDTRV